MAKIAHREELEEERRGSPHPPVKGEREEENTGNLAELIQPEDIVLPLSLTQALTWTPALGSCNAA